MVYLYVHDVYTWFLYQIKANYAMNVVTLQPDLVLKGLATYKSDDAA